MAQTNKNFKASEVQISEFHRFEGMTNPSDTSIIYALEAKNENTRCLLINSYGAKASEEISNFISTNFPDHPGELSEVWMPLKRQDALKNLDNFVKKNYG